MAIIITKRIYDSDARHGNHPLICDVQAAYDSLKDLVIDKYDIIECLVKDVKSEKLAKEIKACCQYRDTLQGQVNSCNTDIKGMCDQYFSLTGKPYKSNEQD